MKRREILRLGRAEREIDDLHLLFDGVVGPRQKHLARAGSVWPKHLDAVKLRIRHNRSDDSGAGRAVTRRIARLGRTKSYLAAFGDRLDRTLDFARERGMSRVYATVNNGDAHAPSRASLPDR